MTISQTRSIILATTNKGKVEEIKGYLAEKFDNVLSLADLGEHIDIIEDRATYFDNATKKARLIANRFGINTLADDSGLEVDALQGRPGIHSARYAPNDSLKIDKLLQELEGIPLENRTASFKAYLAYYLPTGGRVCIFYGRLKGYIGFERKGYGGFGFDPVFMVSGSEISLAQMTMEEKNLISHRGRALASFRNFLTTEG
jgi:XTP/dITP diphosphohydrolase